MNRDKKNWPSRLTPEEIRLHKKRQHSLLLGSVASGALAIGLAAVAINMVMTPEPIEPAGPTGEEVTERTTLYSQIDIEGDPRIRRVIGLMKKTQAGNNLYGYAASQGFQFQWSMSATEAGSYDNGLIQKTPYGQSDHGLALTGVHEIRHGWQDKTLKTKEWKSDPLTTAQILLVSEVDSCAYTAQYAADYKDKTGNAISWQADVYGKDTASSYASRPRLSRDFFKHAVVPCFEEIKKYPVYALKAYERSISYSILAAKASELIVYAMLVSSLTGKPYDATKYGQHFNAMTPEEKANAFSRFFSLDMNGQTRLPEMDEKRKNPELFLAWLNAMTLTHPELAKGLKAQQEEFTGLSRDLKELEKTLREPIYSPAYPSLN